MIRAALTGFALAVTLGGAASSAFAAPPAIIAVDQQDRHPNVALAAPRADSVTVYIATKPDLATDGSFLQENVVETGFLTDAELQTGRWLDNSQINPGTYFVMIRASRDYDSCVSYDADFNRIEDLSCADGFSQIVSLSVTKPETSYRVKSMVFKYIRQASLSITADPLGEKLPYRVCWKQLKASNGRLTKKCVNGTVNGYSWNEDATDSVDVNTKRMTRRTKFTWYSRDDDSVLRSRTITVY